MVPAPVERGERPTGSSATIAKFCSTDGGALGFARAGRRSERSAEFGSVNRSLALTRAREAGRRDAIRRETRRPANQPPSLKLFHKESDSNGRLRVNNWIVQRLNDYAIKKTVEL